MKFSIVTPTCNSQRFLAETIESVINQKGDFSIEYIIVDNCSTDDTERIVKHYQAMIMTGNFNGQCHDIQIQFIQEPDTGMYDAISKGFSKASGDIFAWVNSDDTYLEGAFNQVQKAFSHYPEIKWLKGITSYIDERSRITSHGRCLLYDQGWIRKGLYGPVLYFIQQASVFWRSDLWAAGHEKLSEYIIAGDYYLWRDFANTEPLYSLNVPLSYFRIVAGQKSENMPEYWDEIKQKTGISQQRIRMMRAYFRLESRLPFLLAAGLRRLFFGKQAYHLISNDDEDDFSVSRISNHITVMPIKK